MTKGCCHFFNKPRQPCNYHCKVCKKTGMTPNSLGKFVVVQEEGKAIIKCTGCKSQFSRDELNL